MNPKLSEKQIAMLKTMPGIDQDLVAAYEKNNLNYTPTATTTEKVLPSATPEKKKGSLSTLSAALEEAVSLARGKRQSKELDFLGGVLPKGAVSAGTFTGLLSNLNKASSNFTEPLVQSAVDAAQADEKDRLEQANSIRDLALSLVENGTSQEVVQGILQAKDLDSAIGMAAGAMSAKGKMKTEQIGTKLVQYDPNDPEGTVRVLFDGGSSSTPEKKLPIVTLSPEKKQSLILAGFNAGDIDTIQSDVSEFGLQAVLEGLESDEEKRAVESVYGKEPEKKTPTPEEIKSKVVTAISNVKDTFSREEAKTMAEKQLKSALGVNELPDFYDNAIEDALLEVYGQTFWQGVVPGGR